MGNNNSNNNNDRSILERNPLENVNINNQNQLNILDNQVKKKYEILKRFLKRNLFKILFL